MKILNKLSFAVALFIILAANSFAASTVAQGTPKLAAPEGGRDFFVVVRNQTNDQYEIHATFYDSGFSPVNPIAPVGNYPADTLTYTVGYPDYKVCLTAVRSFDGYRYDLGCHKSKADLNIPDFLNSKKK